MFAIEIDGGSKNSDLLVEPWMELSKDGNLIQCTSMCPYGKALASIPRFEAERAEEACKSAPSGAVFFEIFDVVGISHGTAPSRGKSATHFKQTKSYVNGTKDEAGVIGSPNIPVLAPQ